MTDLYQAQHHPLWAIPPTPNSLTIGHSRMARVSKLQEKGTCLTCMPSVAHQAVVNTTFTAMCHWSPTWLSSL
jgi:hypothetical protein